MNYKRSKYFTTSNKRKVKYFYLDSKSQITIIFFHGFMSDMTGKKPSTLQKFCIKKKLGFVSLRIELKFTLFSLNAILETLNASI